MSPTSRDLAALKKHLLGDKLKRANLQKMKHFTKTTDSFPGAPEWLKNASLLSFYMDWYSEWRKELGPAPPTELGFAVIHSEDIIKFVNRPDASLEDLRASIRAFYVRVIERCHMINRLNGCTDNAEEYFLSGTTYFLTEEKARYVALDDGIVGPADPKGLQPLTQGFGLGTAESQYLHNAGNDAVVTLIVALLAGLYPFAPFGGYTPHTVEGQNIQDIVRAAAGKIKSRSKQDHDVVKYCHRCETLEHMSADCFATIASCAQYGSDQHNTHGCLQGVTKTEEDAGEDVSMGGASI
ncbi:hypothetical protein E8E11_000635 [Didymella keratinophila]|nr:hypothetical protein E8E11_000635 [Didymella keratinophila]